MKRIEINTEMLNNDIARLRSDAKRIRTTADKMYNDLALLDAGWDGNASEVFRVQFTKDRTRLLSICETIEGFIENLTTARTTYEAGENSVAQIVGSIRI